MNYYEEALKLHEKHKGKLEVVPTVPLKSKDDLSTAYSPGVAAPCKAIHINPGAAYQYTTKGNMVAVVTDGSAVLGLGNIGALASLPVMEGKALLFKAFADVNAVPICIKSQDVDEIVRTVINIAPAYGGINLEDISAPRCFEVERRLQEALDIPVFHDDQHGTAIVTVAALLNALKLTKKDIAKVRIVLNGAGAAGAAIVHMLYSVGAKNIIVCDSAGIISMANKEILRPAKLELAKITNREEITGTLADAIVGADVFIGVSVPKVLLPEMVQTMNRDAIVFAMANPEPEIMPELAKKAGARIVGTGRSDFPNQVNNVLVFPGLFKGALSVRAKCITEEMKVAAARAIADMVDERELHEDNIIPNAFDKKVAVAVADAVAEAYKP